MGTGILNGPTSISYDGVSGYSELGPTVYTRILLYILDNIFNKIIILFKVFWRRNYNKFLG